MPSVRLTRSLEEDYTRLYAGCEVNRDRFDEVDALAKRLVNSRPRYLGVSDELAIPWFVIAAIHLLESSQRFDRHLHNGDRLTERTRQVPAGRPRAGTPPFSWEESAQDALRMHQLHRVEEWSLPRILYELEKYNGWGYRLYHPHVQSPYLWGYSGHYRSGKYIADGTWSETAASRQCGAAVVIRRLEELGEIEPLAGEATPKGPLLRYANRRVGYGEDLQRFLNAFEGISVRVDGWPGERTSDAVQQLFGFRLQGDPRD